MSRLVAPIVFSAVLLVAAGGAYAQRSETPEQNVRESQQYDQLTCRNPAFRARRIAQECGPLQGSEFYDGCVASFNCGGGGPTGDQWRQAPPSQTVR